MYSDAASISPALMIVLLWLFVFLAVNVLALFAAAWVARALRHWRERRERRFRELWQPVLHQYMAGDAPGLPGLPPRWRFEFLLLWLQTHGYVRDEDVVRLNELAVTLGLPAYVMQLLRGRRRARRLVAIRAAAALRLHEAGPLLRELARSKGMRFGLAAVSALLQISPHQGASALQALLAKRLWGAAAIAAFLRSAEGYQLAVLTEAMGKAPPGGARELVKVIEALEDPAALPALRARYEQAGEGEEKAALLHALGRLGEQRDRQTVLQALTSAHPLMRMQAAGALGRLGLPEDIWQLLPLLADTDWWVRYRAAQSLTLLVRGDRKVLAVLRARLADRYGREMLDRAIAERNGES